MRIERREGTFHVCLRLLTQVDSLLLFPPLFFPFWQDWLNTFDDPDLRAAAADPDKWKDIMRENARLMYGTADDKEKDEL